MKEAHILKGTSHENVIKMIGVSTEHHPVSLVMEYLTEYTLKQILLDEHTSMDTSMKHMTEMTSKVTVFFSKTNNVFTSLFNLTFFHTTQ